MEAGQNVATMMVRRDSVTTSGGLVASAGNPLVRQIVVRGRLTDVPAVRLLPGQSLMGEGADAAINFREGSDGLELTTDNEVSGLALLATPARRAIFNDTSCTSLGRMRIVGVVVSGQVQVLASGAVRAGHVEVTGLDIIAADTRSRIPAPAGYGVEVMQGAFTLWNTQDKLLAVVSANLKGISVGRAGAPVHGSGVFVSGASANGGRMVVAMLDTGSIYNDGRIAHGTADRITAGVFTGHGAHVAAVRNRGPVVTYGVNDRVLDNWGVVDRWVAESTVISYGAGSTGFSNSGTIKDLDVLAAIETFGQGARGFYVRAGSIDSAQFDRITTHADGAVGVDIRQPIGRLFVRRGIETFGGTGELRVQGTITQRSAVALSIKSGGSVSEVEIAGGVTTSGLAVTPIEMQGEIGMLLSPVAPWPMAATRRSEA